MIDVLAWIIYFIIAAFTLKILGMLLFMGVFRLMHHE